MAFFLHHDFSGRNGLILTLSISYGFQGYTHRATHRTLGLWIGVYPLDGVSRIRES